MADREKVISGLTACTDGTPAEDCRKCPYQGKEYCTDAVMMDALVLLREQEPIWTEGVPFCGECKTAMSKTQDYCHKCGKKVKWDG